MRRQDPPMVGMGGFTAGLNNRADDTAGPKNEAGAPIALREAVNVSLHNDDTPAIAAHWHENLLDWAAHLAFSMIDADTRNEELAMEYARRFDAKVGRLPTMTEIRLWGVSPIVGGQAEFV